MNQRAAVIDIGSNSIKALVAESDGTPFGIRPVLESSLEVRISKGISGNPPKLTESGMRNGIEAVECLYNQCQSVDNLCRTIIVATSAVRSAVNGQDFINEIESRTGVASHILSGEEEADGIAFGVRTDPAVRNKLRRFTVFDLGGGSMELIRFREDHVEQRISLPLGSVRLTEKFICHPELPVQLGDADELRSFIRENIVQSGFIIEAPLIGCSGGLTTWRALRASLSGLKIRQSSALFSRKEIDKMADEVLSNGFEYRVNTLGIPAGRADIYPAAIMTFQILMDMAGTDEIRHSLHNLPYGIAWKALSAIVQDCS